jgi:hypothetical protein
MIRDDTYIVVASTITELRKKMEEMQTDFEGMQALQSQVEILKEVIHDTTDGIENHWFDLYGIELERRIQHRE